MLDDVSVESQSSKWQLYSGSEIFGVYKIEIVDLLYRRFSFSGYFIVFAPDPN